jgi:hypothetical protein
VVFTAFCSCAVRLPTLSVKVSAMRNSMRITARPSPSSRSRGSCRRAPDPNFRHRGTGNTGQRSCQSARLAGFVLVRPTR